MTRAFVALGANLGQPAEQLRSALREIHAIAGCQVTATSPFYRSVAVGPGEQPDYVNAVTQLETTLDAEALLAELQRIETEHGRTREVHWGARTLDLDILLFGDTRSSRAQLTLPHPRMRERNFVLYPLYDLQADLVLPCGTPLESLLASCPDTGLQRLGEVSDPGV